MRDSMWVVVCVVFVSACAAEINDPINDEHRVQAENTFDPDVLHASVTDILQWHTENETEIPNVLQPGMERRAIQERFVQAGCMPTEEVMLLWGWHDGAAPTPHPFLWYHNFLSVEQALGERASLVANPLVAWKARWIPVFEFEGEWYFVECSSNSVKASPVGYFSIEDPEALVAYASLTRLLETHAAWFRKGAVRWSRDPEGMVEDVAMLSKIHRDLNQGAVFPYYVE